ncbi:extracellular solute-binding protein [Paenibacillus sp. CC-CFT747]|nr:extracellular solute-binding protein [Paenibacillus sp. CC-CFT747]
MKNKRSAAWILIVIILLTSILAACSKGAQETGASTAPEDAAGKYDPPIEISVIRPYDDNTKYAKGDSAENNEWTRLYEEKLGIKVKFAWTFQGPANQYAQKLNVAIASNDLADIVVVNGNQLKQLVEAGQIEDITKTFNQYSSDYVKKVLNEDGGLALKSATFDGKLMAIPRIGSDIDEVPILWVRTDWLKKLNLPEPKTMADVLAISDAFTNKDPDGNKQADTLGLGLTKDLGSGFAGFEGFLNGHHAYYNTWIKDASGKLVNSNIQPEMKSALAVLQRMYAAKQIDKEFGTKDVNKVAESTTSGKIGMYYGMMWTPLWPLQGGKELDPNMEWKSYMIPSVDDKPAMAQLPFQVPQYYVVKKGAKNPEAAIKMLNLWYDVSFDTVYKPEVYGATEDGVEAFKHAILAGAPITTNMDKYKEIQKALKTNDTSFMKPNFKNDYKPVKAYLDGDIKGWGMHGVFGPGGSFAVIDEYVNQKRFLRTQFYGSPTPTMGGKGGTLDTLLKEAFTKIIMGAAPIDEFDTFVENWKKLGGDQITQEVNDWYAKQ